MKEKQKNISHEFKKFLAPIFHQETAKKNATLEERYMLQDDAWKAFNVDVWTFFDDLEDARNSRPDVDDAYIWTIHETDDHQYWVSGTSSFVDRWGYYVATKPVPGGIKIVTSSQCTYCDKEECVCELCPACKQRESRCECDDDYWTR